MRSSATRFNLRFPGNSRRTAIRGSRRGLALAAVPTALAVGVSLAPHVAPFNTPEASAQSPAADLSSAIGGGSSLSDSIAPSDPPKRTPIDTQYPKVEGLPAGVDVTRVEYRSPRDVMVYIKSAAMPEKEQKVNILLARDWYSQPDKTFPEVWALDGLRARDDESGWTIETNIAQQYADKNINVIMPVGGESSFYTDWEKPDNGKRYMWETFLTRELVPVLDNEFRSNKKRALVGISMGGTAAMNLAERNPYLFDFVGSFSGYLDTSSQGMPEAIAAAQWDAGKYTATNMWGPYYSQNWIDHDPKLGIENLKDMKVYVSSGSGLDDFGLKDSVAKGPANMAGVGLEIISRMSTQTFVDKAEALKVPVVTKFRPSGVHSWEYWQFEMQEALPYISDALGLSPEDRGADCQVGGEIAKATKGGQVGTCLTNEYDIADGRAQDFQSGTAYWSPDTGAYALFGRIDARYAEMGGPESWLGFPKTTELATPNREGRFVHFENGSIYWTAKNGAFAIPGDMMGAWGENGWENGDLKFPTSQPKTVGDGLVQEFENGVLTRNPDNSHSIVHGAIGAKYKEMGAAESPLGYPKGGEIKLEGGAFQEFENGNIYWSPSTGAHFILNGQIFDEWGKRGWERGELGYPTSDLEDIPAGGLVQRFQHGTIRHIMGVVQVSTN